MEYEYWASFGREHQMTLPDVTVTIEVREAEHDPDAEALIARELARLLRCSEDRIGHANNEAAPVDVNLTHVVLELAIDMAVRKAVGVIRYTRDQQPR